MKLELVNSIHLLIIWQSLLFSIVLLTPKFSRKKSNKFLVATLFTLGIHFIYNILYTNNYLLEVLPPYSCSYGYLYGPLLFLYVRFHLKRDAVFKPLYWLHFLPFVFIIISTAIGYPMCSVLGILLLPAMLIYSIAAFREIAIYKKTLKNVSSQLTHSELKWLILMLTVTISIVILNVIQQQVPIIHMGDVYISMEVVVQVVVLLLVNLIIVQGLKMPQSFQQVSDTDIKALYNKDKGNINKDKLQKIANKLQAIMKREAPYLNPNLNITLLAEAINEHEKTVSQTINHIFKKNFADFINTYRIEDAKRKLTKKQKPPIAIKEVMYSVGFNSRSVFNTVFKSKTGLTPSQYSKKNTNKTF